MRRAAGTVIFVDVLLRLLQIQRRSPAKDLQDLDAGQTLVVAGFSKTVGGERMISAGKGRQLALLKRGDLQLTAGRPPVWVQRNGGQLTAELVPPLALKGEGEKVPAAPKFRRYTLVTGDGTYDLAVPLKDVDLVRHALAAVR
jgi:hypothetical protein